MENYTAPEEGKLPVWLDIFEMEVLNGFIAELLDSPVDGYARTVLESVYTQLEENY